MGRLIISDHPLIQHKMSLLRNKETGCKEFRELTEEIAMLLCYEATKNIELTDVKIETPLATADCKEMKDKFAVVSILRAGIGMTDGILKLIPTAKVGHIGLYRDPASLIPVEYYCKLPADIHERIIIIVDPMLATGGTATAAITFLKEHGAKKISFLCIVAGPDGVKQLQQEHPDVDVYTAAYDAIINSKGYIVPGLGDAGDRIFGTK